MGCVKLERLASLQQQKEIFVSYLNQHTGRVGRLATPELEQEFWHNHRVNWIGITRHYSMHMILIFNLYILTLTFGSFWFVPNFEFDPILFTANYIFGLSTFVVMAIICIVPRYRRYYSFAMMMTAYLAMTVAAVVAFIDQPLKSSWQASLDCFYSFIFFYFLCGVRSIYIYFLALMAGATSISILAALGSQYDYWLFFCVYFLSATVLFLMSLLARSKDRIGFVQKKIVSIERQINVELQNKLRLLSEQDPLTQLGNRRAFDEQIKNLLSISQKQGKCVGLLFADIDYFKRYNDWYGHPAGDATLQRVAAIIRDNIRPHDVCFRIGGEEFVVLLPDCDLTQAQQVAERLRQRVWAADIPHERSKVATNVTLSIGVAMAEAGQYHAERLLKYADDALYAAKAAGRNQVMHKPLMLEA